MEYVGIAISLVAIILFILMLTRFKGNRNIRLALYLTLMASVSLRLVLNYRSGAPVGVLDGFALVFFSAVAGTEIAARMRKRPR